MNTRALLGTTTGEFDSLRVRSPPYTGSHIEVASLVAGAAYDDTQITQDIAQAQQDITQNATDLAQRVLTDVPLNASFVLYQHPATHTIAEVSGLQLELDGKADDTLTTAALANKADSTALTAGLATKADIGDLPMIQFGTGFVPSIAANRPLKLIFDNCDVTTNGGSPALGYRISPTPLATDVSGLATLLSGKNDAQTWVDGGGSSHLGITSFVAPGSSVSGGVMTLPTASSGGLVIYDAASANQTGSVSAMNFKAGHLQGATMNVGVEIVDATGTNVTQLCRQLTFEGGIPTSGGDVTVRATHVFNPASSLFSLMGDVIYENSNVWYDVVAGAWKVSPEPTIAAVQNGDLVTQLAQKQAALTFEDGSGTTHTTVTSIVCPGSVVTGSTLTLPSLATLSQAIATLQAEIDALKKRWSINTTVSAPGWYTVGIMASIATGEFIIRSDHNIVHFRISRLYDAITGAKISDTLYSASASSFTSVRVKEHPSSMYTNWAVQIYAAPAYVTTARQFSALWQDMNPSGHGVTANTMSILPCDFVPDATAITSPVSIDVSSWAVAYTLAL
jgi:hypothetical protein